MGRQTSSSISMHNRRSNSGRDTPTSQSKARSRAASVAVSLHKAYDEVKKKGLCKL